MYKHFPSTLCLTLLDESKCSFRQFIRIFKRPKIINFLEAATEFLGEVPNIRNSYLKAFYFIVGYFLVTFAATNKSRPGYLND